MLFKKLKTLLQSDRFTWTKITYFSPKGDKAPNGVAYYNGAFVNECLQNKQKFIVPNNFWLFELFTKSFEKTESGLLELDKLHFMVLPNNEMDTKFTEDELLDFLNKEFNTNPLGNTVFGLSYGNYFKGEFKGKQKSVYTKQSVCLVLQNLNNKKALNLSKVVALRFNFNNFLIKHHATHEALEISRICIEF